MMIPPAGTNPAEPALQNKLGIPAEDEPNRLLGWFHEYGSFWFISSALNKELSLASKTRAFGLLIPAGVNHAARTSMPAAPPALTHRARTRNFPNPLPPAATSSVFLPVLRGM
jgi:hypothetical protein